MKFVAHCILRTEITTLEIFSVSDIVTNLALLIWHLEEPATRTNG